MLADARIAVLGVGGLGGWSALNLACVGVGEMLLLDFDRVELTNLNRQVLYSESDNGRYKAVADFLERDASTREFMDRLEAYLRFVIPFYVAEGKSYLTIAIGCTGGRHRSVMITERLRKGLGDIGTARVRVRHRDLVRA